MLDLMAIIKATVRLRKTGFLPVDDIINVWHFQSLVELDATISAKIAEGLELFYRPIYPLFSGMMVRQALLAGSVQTATVTPGSAGPSDDVVSRVFDTHDIPAVTAFPAAMVGTSNYPAEVAICLSFRGDIEGVPEESGSTRPAARRRGRLYLGNFNTGAGGTALTSEARPLHGTTLTDDVILDAYDAMLALLITVPKSVLHIVYSPTAAAQHVVTQTSVDNAFDTVRSRGVAPNLRETRAVAWGTL